MRYWPASFVLPFVLLLAACGSTSHSTPQPQQRDMTTMFSPDPPDLAFPPDLAESNADMAQPKLLGCGSIIVCLNKCGSDPNCQANCPPIATAPARMLFNDLLRCILGDKKNMIDGACKSWGGGVCDPNAPHFDAQLCSDCQNTCQQPDGPCFQALADCDLNCEIDSECKADPQARCIDHICQLP